MAKNYTIQEAVEIIAEGKDAEAIVEIGKRFPLLAVKIAGITAKAKDEFVDFMSFMPEYLTANKVNSSIKKALLEGGSDEDESEDADTSKEENPAKGKAKAAKKAPVKDVDEEEDADENDFASMTGKQLWDMLGEKGLRKDCKEKCGTKKAEILEYIEKYGLEGDTEEAAEEEETDENPYEGKSAMELFKECKKRGIKAQPKKPAKFYADLLIKDDEATADADTDEDDDWDDEEEEVPAKPAKPAKGKEKKAAKPAKKSAPVEEEDDDDWDI